MRIIFKIVDSRKSGPKGKYWLRFHQKISFFSLFEILSALFFRIRLCVCMYLTIYRMFYINRQHLVSRLIDMRPFSVTMVPLSDFLMILGDIIIYEFVVGVSESFLFRIVETYITFQGVRKKTNNNYNTHMWQNSFNIPMKN